MTLDTKGVMALTAPASPDADPVPWLTELWRKNGCFTADFAKELAAFGSKRSKKPGLYESEESAKQRVAAEAAFGSAASALAAVVANVGSAVSALHSDPNPYSVRFGNISSAGTDHAGRNVLIGTRLLTLTSLTEGQRAAGLVGIALHETGHIEFSQPYGKAIREHFGEPSATNPTGAKAYSLHNVGEDNRIERLQLGRFPALTAALDCAAFLMGELVFDQITAGGKTPPFNPDLNTAKGRDNALKMGTRYPYAVDWSTEEATKALTYIRGWAERMSADHTPKQHVALVEEALEWINDLPEAEEPQPTEGGDEGEEPQPTEGGEKGEPKEGNPGNAEGDDEDGDGASDESEDGEDTDSGDTEGDTEDEGEGEGEGESADPSDPYDEPKDPKGGSPTDADAEGDDSDPIDDPEGGEEGGDQPEDMPDGNPEGDTDSDAKTGNTEGETPQSGEVGSDTEGEVANSIPEIPDEVTDSVHDSELDEAGDDLTQAHQAARRAVKRTRRYPGATGGTVLVQEVLVKDLTPRGESWVDFMSLGDSVTEDDEGVKVGAQNAIALSNSTDYDPGCNTTDNPTTHAALAAVLVSARKGPGAPTTGQRSGRIDRGRLSRVVTGDPRVFTKVLTPAPQKVRVHIVIDASGSMSNGEGSRRHRAAQVGRDLAGALDRLPWATGRIYGFADANINFVSRIWQSGQDRKAVDDFLRMPSGGTPLGYCIAYVADDLLEEKATNEKGVVIVVSDGAGSYSEANHHTKGVVDYYRSKGLRVVSVAMATLGSGQQLMFGKDAIAYEPDMRTFARNLAKVIGSSL